tara:strand:+ start:215 stop:688 length:474 start_codon:yes stop_codon:yes gene_type:complete
MANPFDFTAGAVLTAAQLNQIADFEAKTPSWEAGITAGDATQTLKVAQVNEICMFELEFEAGSSSSFSTSAFKLDLSNSSMPASASELSYAIIGGGWCRPQGSTIYALQVVLNSGDILMYAQLASSTYTQPKFTKSTIPETWNTSANFYIQGIYRTT